MTATERAGTAGHTPTPWVCDDYYTPNGAPDFRVNGVRIARMHEASYYSPSPDEQKANQVFILEAVNGHDALLARALAAEARVVRLRGAVDSAVDLLRAGPVTTHTEHVLGALCAGRQPKEA